MKLCERALIYGAGSLGPHRSPHRCSIKAEEGSAWSQGLNLQAPLSLGSSRQEYWKGVPFPSPGDPPDPEIESMSPTLRTDSLPTEPLGSPLHHRVFWTKSQLGSEGFFYPIQPWAGSIPCVCVCVCVSCSVVSFCDPVDYSLPGSSVHGLLQATILEWVAIPFSRGSS